ncbi:hypothetical protein [Corynebacterium spheniscorum]|uniref:Uncharacterized protein n=1 Tax=Corynebacterium spheniscorum TaxID=185761 RepID=A0A1I2T9H5_9CORY|nr:hypothetical protein [Corynebacterium spheniscorum]SFG59001.1 hypothetical protein SAMN05660282_01312 [Corynebacterium spheniscorum]
MDIAAIRELLGNFGTFVKNFAEFFPNLFDGIDEAVAFSSVIAAL